RALATFHQRLSANPGLPLVRAGRRVAGLAGLGVLPSERKHIYPAGESASKERDLLLGRRSSGYARPRLAVAHFVLDAALENNEFGLERVSLIAERREALS
ncbi:MAG: hypothetical protein ABI647_21645, partial [Gemmatimonadota bacterium]